MPNGENALSDNRILVVDDDRDFADSLRGFLVGSGHVVDVANSRDAALALFHERAPAVALLDIRLGRENGLDLLARLHQDDPDTSCVMITAQADTDSAITALQNGASDYLRKPFLNEDLLATLKRCFENRRLRREKNAAELAMRTSESRLRVIIDNYQWLLTLKDLEGRYLLVNEAYANSRNISVEDAIGRTASEIESAELAAIVNAHDQEVIAKGTAIVYERDAIRQDGSRAALSIVKFPAKDADGKLMGVGTISVDITERKRAEDALRESENQLHTITDSVPVLISYMDADRTYRFVNKTMEDWYGMPATEIIGKTVGNVLGEVVSAKFAPYLDRALAGESVTFEDMLNYPDGSERNVHISYVPDITEEGTVRGYFGLAVDLTARRQVEAALKETEARLSDAIESISEGFILYDPDDCLVLCNEKFKDFYPQIRDDLFPGVRLEDIARKAFERGAVKGSAENVEYWLSRRLARQRVIHDPHEQELPDGTWLLCSEHKTSDGYTVGIRTDITEIKRTGDQLRQAQKMEAVGQLTGGIAHDFNNMLGVIIGNLDFLAEELQDNAALLVLAEAATKAALNGAKLNRQLLAFSRKQALSPMVTDLNAQVLGMFDMLRRTLGETVDVVAKQGNGPWTTLVDPAQLESALLNLAVNARDAMPAGGTLTIETTKVRLDAEYVSAPPDVIPGDYVMLAVTDTGSGMSPEILAQVFEPFFTTKDVGKGSGLGLSMVFGFAKQSSGHVEIESDEGVGTTVKLYLPHTPMAATVMRDVSTDIPKAKGETILVVEDDPELLTLAVTVLNGLGYEVLAAEDGKSALTTLENVDGIDLLLTDVVMPGGVSGPALAAEAVARHSEIKVLYMSGYTQDKLQDRPDGENETALLRKPFRRPELARMIRTVLDKK